MNTTKEYPTLPGAPEDELFGEFQAYVKTIYEAATQQTTRELESGVQSALAKLQNGIQQAVSGVQVDATDLSKSVKSAQEDFRGMFEPIFEDYRRKLIQDQLHFMDALAGKLAPVYQEQHKANNENLRVQAEQIVLNVQNRFDAMKNIVTEKTQLAQKSNEDLQAAMQRAQEEASRDIKEKLAKAQSDFEAASRTLERVNQDGWSKAVAANQQALDLQVSRLDKMVSRMTGYMIGLAALSAVTLTVVVVLGR